MRLQLTLSTKKHSVIPINYNGYINAFIYKTLFGTNPEFAQWLHEKGVGENAKKYKLFTFSNLRFRPFAINKETQQIKINSTRVYLTISFYLDDAMRHFVTGLFQKQQFSIGDKWNYPVNFTVDFVEVLPEPSFSETMRFRALQPICISKRLDDRKHATYLSPTDDGYADLFFQNLMNRYQAAQAFFGHAITSNFSDFPFQLQTAGRIQRKVLTFKANSDSVNKIAGYKFDFELTAPLEVLKIGYNGGFGEKGSQGFGYVEVVR